MKRHIRIYLCGSIKKGTHDNSNRYYWGNNEEYEILRCFKDHFLVKLLNPATIGIERSDSFSNFGADVFLIRESDFVFVDARDKKGIGIGSEMVIAKHYSVPVVSLCPLESPYRQQYIDNICGETVTNWVHPFITGLSDFVADTIEMGVKWMLTHLIEPKEIKRLDVLNQAIEHFSKKQKIQI